MDSGWLVVNFFRKKIISETKSTINDIDDTAHH